jgi:hypothetical protein
LQSSVFGGGYEEGVPVDYNKDDKRVTFGSSADWKTAAGMAKPVNVGPTRADTFLQRQKQLASSVLEQTDYTGYMPMKKSPIDLDNFGHEHTHAAKGRKTTDDFKARSHAYEPVKKDYDPKAMVTKTLGSVFDKNTTVKVSEEAGPQPTTYAIPGRESQATKQAMLASNCPATGQSTLQHYHAVKEQPQVIDLTVQGLPEHMDARELKKISGAKHVISATVDEDKLKGTCLGTGRIQIRLNQGET